MMEHAPDALNVFADTGHGDSPRVMRMKLSAITVKKVTATMGASSGLARMRELSSACHPERRAGCWRATG